MAPHRARRGLSVFCWPTRWNRTAGLCEGKLAQFVEAEHERTPGLLFMVNSVSLANVTSRPPEVAGFPAPKKDTPCSRIYLFRFLLHRSSLDLQQLLPVAP